MSMLGSEPRSPRELRSYQGEKSEVRAKLRVMKLKMACSNRVTMGSTHVSTGGLVH